MIKNSTSENKTLFNNNKNYQAEFRKKENENKGFITIKNNLERPELI